MTFILSMMLALIYCIIVNMNHYQHADGYWTHYGGLSPLVQAHFTSHKDELFSHNPPRRRGLYAFPRGYEDLFLIGSTMQPEHISQKSFRLKDAEGNLLPYAEHVVENYDLKRGASLKISDELRKILKSRRIRQKRLFCDDKGYIAVLRPPRTFRYTGELWHHLAQYTHPIDIIDSSGSWVKTSFKAWKNAFARAKRADLRSIHKDADWKNGAVPRDPYRNPFRLLVSVDALEIFIERLK